MHNLEVNKIASDVFDLGGFFAGGYARWEYFQDDKPYGDVDVFCTTSLAFDRLAEYFIERYGVPVKSTQFALTWGNVGHDLQLIKPDYDGFGRKLYGSPEQVINEFDFTVIAIALTGAGFIKHPDFVLDNNLNELRWLHQPSPAECLANYKRLMKYARKGFGVPIATMMILARAIAEAGLQDYRISDLNIGVGYNEDSDR